MWPRNVWTKSLSVAPNFIRAIPCPRVLALTSRARPPIPLPVDMLRSHDCRLIYHSRNRSLVVIRFRHTRRSIVAATDPAQTACLWKRVMPRTTDTRELKGKEDGKNVFDRKHNDGVSDIWTALAADTLTAGGPGGCLSLVYISLVLCCCMSPVTLCGIGLWQS